METKPAKRKSAGKLVGLGQKVTEIAFSKGMGGVVADFYAVPAEKRQDFQIAYTLAPLNRAKECIDIACYLADGGSTSEIELWVKRYEKLGETVLPKWARRKSNEYLRKTYGALEQESSLTSILSDFKSFMYGVFCRALMEHHEGGES